MQAPCYGCTERHENCHAECERYKAFREEYKKREDELKKERYVNDYFGHRKIKVARCFKRNGFEN